MSQTSGSPIYHLTKDTLGSRHGRQEDPFGWPTLVSREQKATSKRPGTHGFLQKARVLVQQQETQGNRKTTGESQASLPLTLPAVSTLPEMPDPNPHKRTRVFIR